MFLLREGEGKFYYLDLRPEEVVNNGVRYMPKVLNRWGPRKCFCVDDLYTTQFGDYQSTEIEEKFFGRIDDFGSHAHKYFSSFDHTSWKSEFYEDFLLYMSTQKLRTPKGIGWLKQEAKTDDQNVVLLLMQRIRALYCAHWVESVWSIADASDSEVKFIVSDHPVTIYNKAHYPKSAQCKGFLDPDIWQTGSHTIFPLSLNKVLILTNLSWLRNPYSSPTLMRPNPDPWRDPIFDWRDIQIKRMLSETEVSELNYIIKSRAYRYIAAAEETWLYPEANIRSRNWEKFGNGCLCMPDPRSVDFGGEIYVGYNTGKNDAYDEYGHKPWQSGFGDEKRRALEHKTFDRFQGEFARYFGPKRRGVSYSIDKVGKEEDSEDFHNYHLSLAPQRKGKKGRRKK
ncbi:MAG: hypothetical protein ACJAT5_000704 [Lentimonas sp.]|jgi:hypothetical protein